MDIGFTGFLKSVVMPAVVCLGLLGGGGDAHAHGQRPRVHQPPSGLSGSLTTRQVDCGTLCTEGVLTGSLAGRLDWALSSMTPTEDPAVFLYVGTQTITTPSGKLVGTDHGVWNVENGEFVDYMTFSETTGAYAGRTGSFSIWGTFDPVSGKGRSEYKATLSACD